MGNKVVEYLREYRKERGSIPVSPIWGGEKAFPFMCLDHRTLAEMLGFEVIQATPVLATVREGQLSTGEQIDQFLSLGRGSYQADPAYDIRDFDRLIIEKEVQGLHAMKQRERGNWAGGGCFGPLTVLSGIVGIGNLLRKTIKAPNEIRAMLRIVTDLMIELAAAEREEGMDFFWIAEPLASVVAPRLYDEFSGKWTREILDAADAPGFLHVCGNTTPHTRNLLLSGASVLSIDTVTDIGTCIRAVPEDVAVMGNISPDILCNGTADEVRGAVRDVLDAVDGFDNFILSTGCSIVDGTPDSNMQIMFEEAGK